MICSYCHTENKEGAKFCNECGKILVPTTEEVVEITEKHPSEDITNPDTDIINDSNELNDLMSEKSSLSPAELIELAALELKALGETGDVPVVPDVTDKQSTETKSSTAADTSSSKDTYLHATDKTAPLDPTPPAAFAPTKATAYDATTDLSGIDECLVDSSYVPPQKAWRGSTMEMKAVKEDGSEKSHESTEHRSQKTPVRQPLQKKSRYALIIIGGLVVVIALLIYITYALEMWGGKIIPDVTGKTQVDAEYLLGEKGFAVETNEVHSDETQGIVLYVTPQVGSRTDSEDAVIINVSIPRVIPDVADAQYDDVLDALHEQGISNITTKEERSSEESGLVLNITPQPGSIVKASDEVVVTVAVPFAVPNVLGLTYEEAQAALDKAGYDTTVIYDSRESDRNNIVLFTDPAPDTLLEPGSTVTLTISQSRGATLIEETNKFLQDLQKNHNALIATNGNAYLIKTIDSVKSLGNETTAFVATATTTLDTQTEFQISGTIVWDALNYIVSIDVDS